MKIKLNSDQEVVNTIREGLKRTGGYCPCRLERTEATKCMCQEFKDQIADPNFEGYCHCMLYYKSLKDRAGTHPLLRPRPYSLMLTSLLITMVLDKPRTQCAFYPAETIPQSICKLKNKDL